MSDSLRSKLRIIPLYLVIACCGVLSLQCGLNLFPVAQDVSLGQQIDREIQQNPQEYPPLRNDAVREYVQGIVNQVVRSPAIQYRDIFPYKVTIINDDKTVNAFATPGGYIYVYTGLLRFLDNEAALAGVLGHEIAHAEERHGTEHMTTQLGLELALSVALGENPSELERIAGSAAALLALLKNSRDDELEADTRAFAYLQSTPYWPGAIKLFFEKMMQQEGRRGGALEEWTSTHPLPQSRIDNVNKLLREAETRPPTEGQLMAGRYQQMLRTLRR